MKSVRREKSRGMRVVVSRRQRTKEKTTIQHGHTNINTHLMARKGSFLLPDSLIGGPGCSRLKITTKIRRDSPTNIVRAWILENNGKEKQGRVRKRKT